MDSDFYAHVDPMTPIFPVLTHCRSRW
jgi:hypothetical protein